MSPPSSNQRGDREADNWLLAKIARTQPLELPEVQAFYREAERFLAMHLELQSALSGRFRLVRFVLTVFQRPRSQWAAALEGMREDHATLAMAMLERLAVAPDRIQSLLIANDRFDDAARAAAEVRALRGRMSLAPPERKVEIAASVSFPKLHGRLYLLSTFDATFRDDPVLGKLFPPINREKRATRPLPPPPPPPTAAAQLARTASKLQEGVERLLRGR